jgi:hypothetical protein
MRRSCCDPIIPIEKTETAKCWRTVLMVLICFHFFVVLVKIVFLGILSALTDLFGFVILLLAIIRVDYCLTIVFSVMQLFEIFSLIVVLGYFLQSDMGRNVPNKAEPDNGPKPKTYYTDEEKSMSTRETLT